MKFTFLGFYVVIIAEFSWQFCKVKIFLYFKFKIFQFVVDGVISLKIFELLKFELLMKVIKNFHTKNIKLWMILIVNLVFKWLIAAIVFWKNLLHFLFSITLGLWFGVRVILLFFFNLFFFFIIIVINLLLLIFKIIIFLLFIFIATLIMRSRTFFDVVTIFLLILIKIKY